MCGIVGYIGGRQACPVLVKGLRRLEYRGYDSAGVALVGDDGRLSVFKCKGKIDALERFLADKAMNLGDWEAAQNELKILCELVPDRDDPRHAEATARLVDVENRMKKARGGK